MRLITRYKLQLALCCLLASGIPAVIYLVHVPPVIMGPDSDSYHNLAVNLLRHHAFSSAEEPPYEPTLFRPPGYPLFLTIIYAFANQSVLAVRVVQLVLLYGVAWMVFRLSCLLVPRTAAFV